jgi:hypothetical protein
MYVRPLIIRLVLLICLLVLFVRIALEVSKLFSEFDGSTIAQLWYKTAFSRYYPPERGAIGRYIVGRGACRVASETGI